LRLTRHPDQPLPRFLHVRLQLCVGLAPDVRDVLIVAGLDRPASWCRAEDSDQEAANAEERRDPEAEHPTEQLGADLLERGVRLTANLLKPGTKLYQ
jgi:hypothetical protein